jgi:hypothetical protein
MTGHKHLARPARWEFMKRKECAMTVIIIAIAIGWVIFSGLLVTALCMNSSSLSRIDEPFKSPARIARERRRQVLAENHPPIVSIHAKV